MFISSQARFHCCTRTELLVSERRLSASSASRHQNGRIFIEILDYLQCSTSYTCQWLIDYIHRKVGFLPQPFIKTLRSDDPPWSLLYPCRVYPPTAQEALLKCLFHTLDNGRNRLVQRITNLSEVMRRVLVCQPPDPFLDLHLQFLFKWKS